MTKTQRKIKQRRELADSPHYEPASNIRRMMDYRKARRKANRRARAQRRVNRDRQ